MKKLYTLIFTVLITSYSFAQLTVRGTSYIFVDGTGFTDTAGVAPLFVTDEVNLTEAATRIYLRNEAQLIQGSGTTGNSGLGELSVQQNGTAATVAYNYWCSPVGNNSVAAGNEDARVNLIDDATGLITSLDAGFTSAYDGISSPLQISNRWFYSFEVSDEYSEWSNLTESSPIPPGLGFTMKGTDAGTGQVYDFRGKPNRGTITNSIAADQFTLIGNPYPSAIDALLLIHDPQNTNIDVATAPDYTPTTTGVLYYWEQEPTNHFTASYIGGYGAYTISSGGVESFSFPTFYAYDAFGNSLPVPPGPAPTKTARRYIPVGQGFMVEGTSTTPAGSFIYVKDEHRVFAKESSGNSYFFRTDGDTTAGDSSEEIPIEYNEYGLNIVPDGFKRFRLNVIFNQEYTRQLLQNFHNSATDGFDYGLEAPTSEDAPTDVTWIQDDEPYTIQAHRFDIEKRIPLVIKAENQQPIDFSIFDVQNFDESQAIYLHDIETELYINLREQNYSMNLPAGTYNNRFEITFQAETLSTASITDEDFEVFQNTENAELTILNPNGLDIKSVTLFDITGKRVINAENIGNQSDYRFSTKSLSDGVYVATITVNDNKAISKKVMISN